MICLWCHHQMDQVQLSEIKRNSPNFQWHMCGNSGCVIECYVSNPDKDPKGAPTGWYLNHKYEHNLVPYSDTEIERIKALKVFL